MLQFKAFIFQVLVGLFLVACSRGGLNDGSTTLSFQLPTLHSKSSLSGSGCFAVSIVGENIPATSPGVCDSSYGVFAGLVPAGGSVEITAPFGESRSLQIFYVLSHDGCGDFDPALGLGQVYGANKVWRVSKVDNLNFNQAEMTVQAPIEFPSSSNQLGTLVSAPASCLVNPNPVQLVKVSQARVVQGSTSVLPGGVGTTENGSRMRVRVYNKKLDFQSPTDFSGRIQPVRLGDP